MNEQNGQQELMKQWNDMAVKKRRMNEEMLTKEQNMIDEIMKRMMEKDEENVQQKKEILALKMKMAKMEAVLKAQNLSISWPAGLPSELLNELFGSLPMENAFGLLAKMPNGLLARNVQKMLESIKQAIKNNKWNMADCGSNLTISEDGLIAKHSGSSNEHNSVRAILPIPNSILNAINKPTILFYFEIEILNQTEYNFGIGFCDQKFPLQGKWLGQVNNSIGIWRKDGMLIDGSWKKIGNDHEEFKKRDFAGFGIILQPNSKIECFVTWNGKLFGKTELSSKFNSIQLFPAADLYCVGDSIRANFVKESWKFKEFGRVLE